MSCSSVYLRGSRRGPYYLYELSVYLRGPDGLTDNSYKCHRFNATPCIGVAACALDLRQLTEMKAQIMVLKYLFKGPGYGP